MDAFVERRRKRSNDPIVALHYQLAEVRRAGQLDAVVLVDESGCLVAGAGAWPVCEELAAYAPLLAQPERVASDEVAEKTTRLASETFVAPFCLDGMDVLFCAKGEGADQRGDYIEHAAMGCHRILATKPIV